MVYLVDELLYRTNRVYQFFLLGWIPAKYYTDYFVNDIHCLDQLLVNGTKEE